MEVFDAIDWTNEWEPLRKYLGDGHITVPEVRQLEKECHIFLTVEFDTPYLAPIEGSKILKELVFRIVVAADGVIVDVSRIELGDVFWEETLAAQDAAFLRNPIDRTAPFVRERLERVYTELHDADSPWAKKLWAKAAYESGLIDLVTAEFSSRKEEGIGRVATAIETHAEYEEQFFVEDFGYIVANSQNLDLVRELIVGHFEGHPFAGKRCHALTASRKEVPPKFSPPVDLTVPHNPTLITVRCSWPYSLVRVGTGEGAIAMLGQIHQWNGEGWRAIDLASPFFHKMIDGKEWYKRESYALLKQAEGEQSDVLYLAGYACRDMGSDDWKCGCRDESCETQHWSVQAFSHDTERLAAKLGSMPSAPGE